jgi:hypothetical protein
VSALCWNELRGAGGREPAEWEMAKNRVRTEASSLDVSLLSSGGIRIGISEDRVLADGEVLVKAPLPRARETWLGG